jgi:hypothetical protein
MSVTEPPGVLILWPYLLILIFLIIKLMGMTRMKETTEMFIFTDCSRNSIAAWGAGYMPSYGRLFFWTSLMTPQLQEALLPSDSPQSPCL